MHAVLISFARALGFEKESGESSESEGEEYWGIDNPRRQIISELLEQYFSGINLDRDVSMVREMSRSSDGSVPVIYLLNRYRIRKLKATSAELLDAAANSDYLEIGDTPETIRLKVKYVPDPNRTARILRLSGFALDVPLFAQKEFLQSVFEGNVVWVGLERKFVDDDYTYTGNTFVELTEADLAKEAEERKIQYGAGTLEVMRVSEYEEQLGEVLAATPAKAPARVPKKSGRN